MITRSPLNRVGFRRPERGQTPANTGNTRPVERRNVAFANGTSGLSRKRGIRPFSAKRIAERPARAECRAAVVARDCECQFFPILERYFVGTGGEEVTKRMLRIRFGNCIGDLVPHELGHSRNVGRTNPDASVAMCVIHNNLIETLGQLAYDSGLLVRANGFRIRKGAAA